MKLTYEQIKDLDMAHSLLLKVFHTLGFRFGDTLPITANDLLTDIQRITGVALKG